MALATIYTRRLIGIQAPSITMEAHVGKGLPAFTLVVLPESTVRASRDRVRCAILNSGYQFPARRITVSLAPADLPKSLAPADLPKEGARYDLPVALAILAATQQLPGARLKRYEFLGELSLAGELRGVMALFRPPTERRATVGRLSCRRPIAKKSRCCLAPRHVSLTVCNKCAAFYRVMTV